MTIKVTFIIEHDNRDEDMGYPTNSVSTTTVLYNDYVAWPNLVLDFVGALEGDGFVGVRDKVLFVNEYDYGIEDRAYEHTILKSELEFLNDKQRQSTFDYPGHTG